MAFQDLGSLYSKAFKHTLRIEQLSKHFACLRAQNMHHERGDTLGQYPYAPATALGIRRRKSQGTENLKILLQYYNLLPCSLPTHIFLHQGHVCIVLQADESAFFPCCKLARSYVKLFLLSLMNKAPAERYSVLAWASRPI